MLLPGGTIEEADLVVGPDGIERLGEPVGRAARLRADGFLILPGLVDLHGDAFERQLMPRPRVSFDPRIALRDTDRQLVANGITTAFHGLTCSWEPGLRGREAAVAFLDALDAVKDRLACDTRLHLRQETFNVDAVDEIEDFRAALGYGIGARWSSPIGSLNLDLAYGEEVNEWRVHFSVGIVLR